MSWGFSPELHFLSPHEKSKGELLFLELEIRLYAGFNIMLGHERITIILRHRSSGVQNCTILLFHGLTVTFGSHHQICSYTV
jgi:hypothetical protein